MATIPDEVRMSDDELAAFLDHQKDLTVATVGPDGWPHAATVWFAFLDGQMVFWGGKHAVRIRNLRHDPRLCLSAESGESYAEIRGVSIRATATIVDDPDELEAIGRAVLERNFPEDARPDPHALAASGSRAGVRVTFERVTAWDFSKKAEQGPQP